MGEVLERRLRMQPIQDPAVGGILNVLVASAALTEQYETVFGQFGLSTSAYNILRILRGTPAGHPRGEIAERMVNRAPDMTRLIDRLARRGLVRRTRSRSDRRVSLTRITPKGIALLERVEPANAALRGRLASRLPAADWRQLSALCERLYGDAA